MITIYNADKNIAVVSRCSSFISHKQLGCKG